MSVEDLLTFQKNIANCYWQLGRQDEALDIHRRDFTVRLARCKDVQTLDLGTVDAAINLSTSYTCLGRHDDAVRLLRPLVPGAHRALGRKHDSAIKLLRILGAALTNSSDRADCDEGVSILENTLCTSRQVLGPTHPHTLSLEEAIKTHVRKTLLAPRFKVGARVECFTGQKSQKGFHKGTVIAHHYFEKGWELDRFAPYQVQLDVESHGVIPQNDEGLIYASEDIDSMIRAAASDSSDERVAAPTAPDGEIRRPGWRDPGADDDDATV